MSTIQGQRWLNRILSEHGMVLVLVLLAGFFSVVTWSEQHPTGEAAADALLPKILAEEGAKAQLLIVVRDSPKDVAFANQLQTRLREKGLTVVGVIKGQPYEARQAIAKLASSSVRIDAYLCNRASSIWGIYQRLGEQYPALKNVRVLRPDSYYWPNFLKTDNLLNIANQIAVIAIMAIGMTMVVIAGGIDLSVGSLIALSAVFTTWLIREYGGGEEASALAMFLCSAAGIVLCALCGLFSGFMVTRFGVPAFIVTLAMMLMASGEAYILSHGQSIDQVPESFIWLGRGADLFGIPNAVVLMFVLYALAYVVMTRMVLGRAIYAVGGNAEAARLSGVPVQRVIWIVFTLGGGLAGLGGVIMASQLKSGSPTYGQMYELFVIAAVVVGGTSLSGGKGKIFGTLVGAFIIAVIQNGMNLTGVESYTQKVVLGAVILAAVLLDRLRKPIGA
jgi:ribose transport system permease protein